MLIVPRRLTLHTWCLAGCTDGSAMGAVFICGIQHTRSGSPMCRPTWPGMTGAGREPSGVSELYISVWPKNKFCGSRDYRIICLFDLSKFCKLYKGWVKCTMRQILSVTDRPTKSSLTLIIAIIITLFTLCDPTISEVGCSGRREGGEVETTGLVRGRTRSARFIPAGHHFRSVPFHPWPRTDT